MMMADHAAGTLRNPIAFASAHNWIVTSQMKKGAERRPLGIRNRACSLFVEEAKLLLEPADPAAAVDDRLLAARPCRMRLGIDVEIERVAFLAPGRTGLEFGAIGH